MFPPPNSWGMQNVPAAISPTNHDSKGGFEHRKSGFWTPVTAVHGSDRDLIGFLPPVSI